MDRGDCDVRRIDGGLGWHRCGPQERARQRLCFRSRGQRRQPSGRSEPPACSVRIASAGLQEDCIRDEELEALAPFPPLLRVIARSL